MEKFSAIVTENVYYTFQPSTYCHGEKKDIVSIIVLWEFALASVTMDLDPATKKKLNKRKSQHIINYTHNHSTS